MPRIEVVTSIHNQQQHRRVQGAITSLFADEGMSAEHVSTEFRPIQHTLIYAGQKSLDEVLGKHDFALLRVYISTRRSQEFRDKFVGTIVRVFEDLGVGSSNVAIDFVPREAVDAYIGTVSMGATRIPRGPVPVAAPVAAEDMPTGAKPRADTVEEDVRELLARFWGGHVRSALPNSTLLALVPNPMGWNSLAKAEIATNLESWLGLPFNTLDVGTERVKQMFGDTVTLGHLVDTLTTLAGGVE
ncbi:hypothetical protein ERC79_13605 [Rhodococcus sp. ABRD24]|uniref:hypothetical protein n=1 Tax=Rhodococcus sp. ABRD24 TaxID=2507582 RepID=UPI00103932C1|nr:hypothetical protein [Rhodococcus sp. ABRD24]QBJ96869.1 hypothetical protein ERC79_13605 [Rhodococcus sp. ABRD24]